MTAWTLALVGLVKGCRMLARASRLGPIVAEICVVKRRT